METLVNFKFFLENKEDYPEPKIDTNVEIKTINDGQLKIDNKAKIDLAKQWKWLKRLKLHPMSQEEIGIAFAYYSDSEAAIKAVELSREPDDDPRP